MSAAHAAGATQRALAKVRAAVDRTDIDATLAAATLPSLSATTPLVGQNAEAASHQLRATDSALHVAPQRLFGGHADTKYADGVWRADVDADRTVGLEFSLTIEVR